MKFLFRVKLFLYRLKNSIKRIGLKQVVCINCNRLTYEGVTLSFKSINKNMDYEFKNPYEFNNKFLLCDKCANKIFRYGEGLSSNKDEWKYKK